MDMDGSLIYCYLIHNVCIGGVFVELYSNKS